MSNRVKDRQLSSDVINQLRKVSHPKLESNLQPEDVEKQKLLLRRKFVLKEIYDTETTYIEYMKVIISDFMEPFNKIDIKDKAIANELGSTLFQNIDKLQTLHWELYKELSSKAIYVLSESTWCDSFIRLFEKPQFIETYQQYINGYVKAALIAENAKKAILGQLQPPNKSLETLGQFIEKRLARTKHGFKILTSYLIAPIQRLPRYILFLKDLLKCTPEDHCDFPNTQRAFKLLDEIITKINTEKSLYDKIYRLEELTRMFKGDDYDELSELICDPIRELLAEGPMIEGNENKKLRYIILFSDLIICATKVDNNTLTFEWKSELVNTKIEFSDGYIKCLSSNRITNCPNPITEKHYLSSNGEDNYSFSFWKDQFIKAEEAKLNLSYVFHNSTNIVLEFQHQLLAEMGEEELFYNWSILEFSKDTYIRKQGSKVVSMMLIKEGFCSVLLTIGDETIKVGDLGPGQLIGEMGYLSPNKRTTATASVVVESEKVIIIKQTYKKLNKTFRENPRIAAKFFHLLVVILANRNIRENTKAMGWKNLINDVPITPVININFVEVQNKTPIKDAILSPRNKKKSKKFGLSSKSSEGKSEKSLKNSNTDEADYNSRGLLSNSSSSNNDNSEEVVALSGAVPNLKELVNKEVGIDVVSSGRKMSSCGTPNSHLKRSTSDSDFKISRLYSDCQPRVYREFTTTHYAISLNGVTAELSVGNLELEITSKILAFQKKTTIPFTNILQLTASEESNDLFLIFAKSRKEKKLSFSMRNSNDKHKVILTVTPFVRPSNLSALVEDKKKLKTSSKDTKDTKLFEDSLENFDLSKRDWEMLLATSERLSVKKGKVIIEQGTFPKAIYHLVEGTCRVELLSANGDVNSIAKVESNEVFGEISFILGIVSSASVVADTDCVVMAIHRERLEILLYNEPKLCVLFYKYIATLLRDRISANQANAPRV